MEKPQPFWLGLSNYHFSKTGGKFLPVKCDGYRDLFVKGRIEISDFKSENSLRITTKRMAENAEQRSKALCLYASLCR